MLAAVAASDAEAWCSLWQVPGQAELSAVAYKPVPDTVLAVGNSDTE